MFDDNASSSNPSYRRATAVVIALGLVIALTAIGIRLGKWAYSVAYPTPADSTVSLSAGFDKIVPTAATDAQQTSGSTQTGSQAQPSQKSSQGNIVTPEGASPQQRAEQTASPTQNTATANRSASAETPRPYLWVAGAVQKLGKPVTAGMVKLTVEKVTGDYRESELVVIKDDGSFSTSVWDLKAGDQIHVQAEVWSDQLGKESPLTDELYLGSPAPIHIRSTLYFIAACALALSLFVFAYAFTGPQNAIKNRVAIVYSYLVIFVALLVPLVGPYTLVHAFPGLQQAMRGTPVGLFVAKPDPESKDSKPEWVLNIGGHVLDANQDPATLEGGLAVPLYVIVLALMGGTINMTRQVPLLQNRSQTAKYTVGLFRQTWRRLVGSDSGLTGSDSVVIADTSTATGQEDWRTGLLNQYMYLLSAPFIAIATYYILYLLGTTRVPILVLVSFSVGLISEHILVAITEFADNVISGLKKEKTGIDKTSDAAGREVADSSRSSGASGGTQPGTPGASGKSAAANVEEPNLTTSSSHAADRGASPPDAIEKTTCDDVSAVVVQTTPSTPSVTETLGTCEAKVGTNGSGETPPVSV